MNLYIFVYTKDKIKEEIKMIYCNNDKVVSIHEIGDIYNLIDYVSGIESDSFKLYFGNFPHNKLNFIYKNIIKYKSITKIDGNYCVTVKNKKRIRGIKHDKMD